MARIQHSITFGLLFAAALATGCASAPLQTQQSTSAIRAAEEVGAEGVPQASLHLQLAREGLAKAQDLSKQGEKARAESMLRRSEADAELAVALAHGEVQRQEAKEAMEEVRELRKSNQ